MIRYQRVSKSYRDPSTQDFVLRFIHRWGRTFMEEEYRLDIRDQLRACEGLPHGFLRLVGLNVGI